MTSDRPRPRPALRRDADGTVRPVAAHLSSLAVDAEALARDARRMKKGKDRIDDPVDLTVTLPKSVRKQLRKKAARYGWTAEDAAAHVLQVWADG